MNRLLLVLAIAATLLLGLVSYELHGLNQRLDHAAARNWGLPVSRPVVHTKTTATETDAQRRERLNREVKQMGEDFRYILKH